MPLDMGLRNPFKHPKSGVYYMEVDRKRFSLKTKDKSEATRLYNKIRKEYLAGRLRRITGESTTTLREFEAEFREWSYNNRREKTHKANMLALQQLARAEGWDIRLSALSLKHIDRLKSECRGRGLKVSSINNYVRHLRSALGKAVEWGMIPSNPFQAAKEERKEITPPQYLTEDEIPRLLAKTKDVEQRRLVVAYIYSGRRRSELVNLRWEDVDLGRGEYYVARSKAHLSKWYPMHPYFRQVLQAIGPQESGPIWRWRHPDTVTHAVKEVLRNAGYGHLRLHQLRHTFAVLLKNQGIDDATIGDLLGHTDRRATEIYAHVTSNRSRDAIQSIKGGPIDVNGEGGAK